MAYFLVSDFRGGLDLRKSALTSAPGTLRQLTNSAITPGGEITKRFAFVPWVTAPGTFGLVPVNNQLYVFQQTATARADTERLLPWGRPRRKLPIPTPLSPTLVTQHLVMPTSVTTLLGVIDWDLFDGKIYVTCLGADNNVYHFYDGIRVTAGVNGTYVKTYRNRMYAVSGRNLYFSVLGNPRIWNDSTQGSGFVNLSAEDGDATDLFGLEVYYDHIAVMSRAATQIWTVDADPAKFVQQQIIRDFGTLAPRSVKQYGNGDILSLMPSGIRSLQARDSSNNATVSDIGSPIDAIFQGLETLADGETISPAIACVDALTGRFWLSDGARNIYILSYFPGPKVIAWSVYVTEFDVQWLVPFLGRVALRDTAGQIYLYGGLSAHQYDSCKMTVETPFLSAQTPQTKKMIETVDMTLWGEGGAWKVEINTEPDAPDAYSVVGNFGSPTATKMKIGAPGYSTHFALRMTHEAPGKADIADLAVHSQAGEAG